MLNASTSFGMVPQIWAETGKLALPIRNYSQILYQFLTFTQNLKQPRHTT